MSAVFAGLSLPIREPLNLALIGIFYFVWQKASKPTVSANLGRVIGFGNIFSMLGGFAAQAMLLIVSWSIAYIGRQIELGPMPLHEGQDIMFNLLFGLVVVLLHAIAEQLLIQKIANEVALVEINPLFGVIISALLFMALQGLQGYANFGFLLSSFCFGLVLGSLAQRFGLFAAAGAHAIWTWAETIAIPQFYNVKMKDNIWSGGGDDTYGSLIFAFVCLSAFAVLRLKLGVQQSLNYKQSNDKIKP